MALTHRTGPQDTSPLEAFSAGAWLQWGGRDATCLKGTGK